MIGYNRRLTPAHTPGPVPTLGMMTRQPLQANSALKQGTRLGQQGTRWVSALTCPLGHESLYGEQPAQLYEAAPHAHVAESGNQLVKNSFLGPSPRVSNSVHLGGSPGGCIDRTVPLTIMTPGQHGEAQTQGPIAQVAMIITMAIANPHIGPSVLCVRLCSQHHMCVNSFQVHNNPMNQVILSSPLSRCAS